MKKYIKLLAIGSLLAVLSSCHQPEYYVPEEGVAEDNGLGIESITVVFPSGTKYADKELTVYNISDPEQTYFDIPIPYYYPEDKDETTHLFLTNLKLKLKLRPNWSVRSQSDKYNIVKIDLTEENKFWLINPQGEKKEIIITGHVEKLKGCQIINFTLSEIFTSGVISEDKKEILIPSLDKLSGLHIKVQLSPHAQITKIGSEAYVEGKAYDFNDGQTITVQAHDENVQAVYTIKQGIPELIPFGFSKSSVSEMFSVDPVTNLGFPSYLDLCYPSLACVGQQLVANFANGTEPILINRYSGVKEGSLKLGSAVADGMTNDNKGNLIICNTAAYQETVNIYVTDDVEKEPVLFASFENPLDLSSGCTIGHRVKVFGDINSDAAIVFTSEGIVDVTTASRALVLNIKGGKVDGEPYIADFSANSLGWGEFPVHAATVVPAGTNPQSDGYFLSYYQNNVDPAITDDTADKYLLHYINKKGEDTWVDRMGNWADNTDCLAITKFNGINYLAFMSVAHFPGWGGAPKIRIYDCTTPSKTELYLSSEAQRSYSQINDSPVGACGDICMIPSSDGFRLYIYYYDHNCHTLGGYVADCIKR